MQKETVEITTEFITMDKLLKFSGVADTGGQAFLMVEDGVVRLNGQLVTEKRKKVHPGDVVNIDDQIELTVAKEAHWLYEKFGEGVYQDVPGLCKVASRAEIAEKNYSLTPGAYVGVAAVKDDGVDFAQRMAEIHAELLKLQAESNRVMDTISKNMKEMGV